MVKDPNTLIKSERKTKLSGIFEWNLVKLAYQELTNKCSTNISDDFQCPPKIDSLLFSQPCVYHYTDIRPSVMNEIREEGEVYTETVTTNSNGKTVYKKCQNLNDLQDGLVQFVNIGGKKEPNFAPGNTTLTVPGITPQLNTNWSCLNRTS